MLSEREGVRESEKDNGARVSVVAASIDGHAADWPATQLVASLDTCQNRRWPS